MTRPLGRAGGGVTLNAGAPPADREGMQPIILICDDDEAVRGLVRAALAREGYEIYEAGDGDELLSCARSLQPDVIVLDMTMPGGSGLEALAVLRRDPDLRQPRVILASAWAGTAEQSAAKAVGVDRFLTKPFTIGQLRATVRELTEGEVRSRKSTSRPFSR
jgi:CheY-like chemotaxis protein